MNALICFRYCHGCFVGFLSGTPIEHGIDPGITHNQRIMALRKAFDNKTLPAHGGEEGASGDKQGSMLKVGRSRTVWVGSHFQDIEWAALNQSRMRLIFSYSEGPVSLQRGGSGSWFGQKGGDVRPWDSFPITGQFTRGYYVSRRFRLSGGSLSAVRKCPNAPWQ